MPARGTRPALGRRQIHGDDPAADERPFARDLRPLREDAHLLFAVRVHLPDVQVTTDGVNMWLHDGVSCWATLTTLPDGQATAYQGGPRRLAE